MTRLRKVLLGTVIAAAAAVPVGVAFAADGTGTSGGSQTTRDTTTGQNMDPAQCQAQHAEHEAQMGGMQGEGQMMQGEGQMMQGEGQMGTMHQTGNTGT